jgi:hypothetical protein
VEVEPDAGTDRGDHHLSASASAVTCGPTPIVLDTLRLQYGGVPAELTGKSPRLVELEPLVDQLTEDQFQMVLGMCERAAKWNRRSVKTQLDYTASTAALNPAKEKYLRLSKAHQEAGRTRRTHTGELQAPKAAHTHEVRR